MRLTTICVIALALFYLSTNQINALGKVTADPNVSSNSIIATVIEDPAASTKISYEGNNLSIEQQLSNITKLSGIQLQPSMSPGNWQVRERTATLLLNNITIADFKVGLAQLFTYRWSHVSDGEKNVYVLRETTRALTARNAAIDDKRQEAAMKRAASIDRAISDASRASSIADKPQDLISAKENDPWIYYLASNPAGQLWAQLIQQVPDEWWQQMCSSTSKDALMYSAKQVPSSITDLFNQVLSLPASVTSSNDADDRAKPFYAVQLISSDKDQAGSLAVSVNIGGKGKIIESIPIGSSDSDDCRRLGRISSLMESGKTPDEAAEIVKKENAHTDDLHSDAVPENKDSFMQQRIKHSPLDAPNKADRKNDTELVRHLRGLASETKLNIMLETFDTASQTCSSINIPKEGTIAEILDAMLGNKLAWQRNGNLLILNYTDWAERRAEEVPKALINRWEKMARNHLGLTFDDLLDIVKNTSYKQFSGAVARNKLLSVAGVREAIESDLYAELEILAQIPDSNMQKLYQSTTGIPLKIVMGLDFSSEPLCCFKKLLDMWYSADPDGAIGIVIKDLGQENLQGHQHIKLYYRLSDGYINWSTGIVTPSSSSVKSFIDTMDKCADKAAVPNSDGKK